MGFEITTIAIVGQSQVKMMIFNFAFTYFTMIPSIDIVFDNISLVICW